MHNRKAANYRDFIADVVEDIRVTIRFEESRHRRSQIVVILASALPRAIVEPGADRSFRMLVNSVAGTVGNLAQKHDQQNPATAMGR